MSQRKVIARKAAAIAGALVLIGALPAEADQTFICNDGATVTVAFDQLKKMKKTNACVASYFTKSPVLEKHPKAAKKASVDVKVAKLRPTKQAKRTAKKNNTHAQLVVSGHSSKAGAPVAAANTDFRNVRILNAKPGEHDIYKHLQ